MSERSKKVTYNVSLHCDGCATKAIKLVARIEGVSSVEINKAQKLTVVGTFDPVDVVKKLRKKFSPVTIVSVEGAEKSGKVKEELEKEESKKANLEKAGTSKEETTKDARKVSVEGAEKSGKMMMEMKANLEKAGTSKEETTKDARKVSVEGAEKSVKMMMEMKVNLEKAGTGKEGPKKGDVGKFENVYVAYNPYLNERYKVEFSDENPNACVIC